jgi:hypothetical protein
MKGSDKVERHLTLGFLDNGAAGPETATNEPAASKNTKAKPAALAAIDNTTAQRAMDDFEALAADTILADDDGDEPTDSDEVSELLIEKSLPQFAKYRTNPVSFDLWGVSYRKGMDQDLFVTTKSFAPEFEEDVDLRRVRFFETVAEDGVIRLVYCFVPEKTGRRPLPSQTSKLAALKAGEKNWMTMRWRKKLLQWTFRPSRKDYGEPKFSGLTPVQFVAKLRDQGLLVDNKDHPFFKMATDSED